MTEAKIVELAMMCSKRAESPMSIYSWSENKSSLHKQKKEINREKIYRIWRSFWLISVSILSRYGKYHFETIDILLLALFLIFEGFRHLAFGSLFIFWRVPPSCFLLSFSITESSAILVLALFFWFGELRHLAFCSLFLFRIISPSCFLISFSKSYFRSHFLLWRVSKKIKGIPFLNIKLTLSTGKTDIE